MAAPSSQFSTAHVTNLVMLAGNYLRKVATNISGASAKHYGEAISNEDTFIQSFLALGIKRMFPNDQIVGEEDLRGAFTKEEFDRKLELLDPSHLFVASGQYPAGKERELCDHKFPSSISPHQRYWCLDPIDGTANYISGDKHKKHNYAVVVCLLLGRRPQYAVAYEPAQRRLFEVTLGHRVRMNNVPMEPLPPQFDPNNISLCYGLGKRATEAVRAEFKTAVNSVDIGAKRYGCLTRSFHAVCNSKTAQGYFSLKEQASKAFAIYLFAVSLGYHCSLDLDHLDFNAKFTMTITHPNIRLPGPAAVTIKKHIGHKALP